MGIRSNWLSRRDWMAAMFDVAAAQGQEGPVILGKGRVILRKGRPERLETALKAYESWLTPNDVFFVRQHLPRPRVNVENYELIVSGRVAKELRLRLADLQRLTQHTVPATLECAGNGRGFFRPRVPGIQWGRGAIGN